MMRTWKRSLAALAALLSVAAAPAPTPKAPPPPFARVYLATRGCMSCAHCRTSIRQMLGPQTKGAETRFVDDQIEVSYIEPRSIPLRDVIQSLANNRLHDLTLVDVLFDATGVLRTARTGAITFEIAETGQPFPLTLDPAAVRPADGIAVRLTAVVEGWREKRTLSLHARDLRAKS